MKLENNSTRVSEIREMLAEIKSSLTTIMISESFLQSSKILLKNSLGNVEKILVILRNNFENDEEPLLKPLHAGLSRSMETLPVTNDEIRSLSSAKSESNLHDIHNMYDDQLNNLNNLKENYTQVINDLKTKEINGCYDQIKSEVNEKNDVEKQEQVKKRENEKRRRKRDSSTLFDISLDDLTEPDHSGLLQEKHSGKEWWCVLQDQHLCMFPSQNPEELAYDVLLVPCCEISLDDVYTESPVFRLTQVGSTPWVFSAGIERNLRAWIRALYRASGRDDYDSCMRTSSSRSKRKSEKKQKRRDMKVFSTTIEEMEEGEEEEEEVEELVKVKDDEQEMVGKENDFKTMKEGVEEKESKKEMVGEKHMDENLEENKDKQRIVREEKELKNREEVGEEKESKHKTIGGKEELENVEDKQKVVGEKKELKNMKEVKLMKFEVDKHKVDEKADKQINNNHNKSEVHNEIRHRGFSSDGDKLTMNTSSSVTPALSEAKQQHRVAVVPPQTTHSNKRQKSPLSTPGNSPHQMKPIRPAPLPPAMVQDKILDNVQMRNSKRTSSLPIQTLPYAHYSKQSSLPKTFVTNHPPVMKNERSFSLPGISLSTQLSQMILSTSAKPLSVESPVNNNNKRGHATLERKETKRRVKVMRWLRKAFVASENQDIGIIGDIFIKVNETDATTTKVWCLLRNNELYCYHEVKTGKLSLIITLAHCHIIAEPSTQPPYSFYIEKNFNERVCTFYAKTAKEREKWMEVLRNKRSTVLLQELGDSGEESEEDMEEDEEDEKGYLLINKDMTPKYSDEDDIYSIPSCEDDVNDQSLNEVSYVSVLDFEKEIYRRRSSKKKKNASLENEKDLKNLTEKEDSLQKNIQRSEDKETLVDTEYFKSRPQQQLQKQKDSFDADYEKIQESFDDDDDDYYEYTKAFKPKQQLQQQISCDAAYENTTVFKPRQQQQQQQQLQQQISCDAAYENTTVFKPRQQQQQEQQQQQLQQQISCDDAYVNMDFHKEEEKNSKEGGKENDESIQQGFKRMERKPFPSSSEEDYDKGNKDSEKDVLMGIFNSSQPGMEGRIQLRENLLIKERKDQTSLLENLRRSLNQAKDKMIVVNNSNKVKSDTAVDTQEEYLTLNLDLVKAKKRLIDIETELRELRLFAAQHQTKKENKEPGTNRKTRRLSKEVKVFMEAESPEVDPLSFNSIGEPPPTRKVFDNIKMFEQLHTR